MTYATRIATSIFSLFTFSTLYLFFFHEGRWSLGHLFLVLFVLGGLSILNAYTIRSIRWSSVLLVQRDEGKHFDINRESGSKLLHNFPKMLLVLVIIPVFVTVVSMAVVALWGSSPAKLITGAILLFSYLKGLGYAMGLMREKGHSGYNHQNDGSLA